MTASSNALMDQIDEMAAQPFSPAKAGRSLRSGSDARGPACLASAFGKRNMITHSQVIQAFCLVTLLLSGCASVGTKHLTANAFLDKGREIETSEEKPFTVYIGAGHRLAYIESWGRFRGVLSPKTMIYWTEIDGLPEDVAARLKAGDCPWMRQGTNRGNTLPNQSSQATAASRLDSDRSR
jgi:hypothetical protein